MDVVVVVEDGQRAEPRWRERDASRDAFLESRHHDRVRVVIDIS